MTFRYKNILKRIGLFAAVLLSVLVGVYLTFRLAFFWLPFLIAFALSSLLEPLIKLLSSKLKLKRKFTAPILILLLLAIIIFLLVLIVHKLFVELKMFIIAAPDFFAEVYREITYWMSEGTTFFIRLPMELTDNIGSVLANLSATVTNLGKSVVKGAFTTAISLPEALIFTIITILATFFMSSDREKIAAVFVRHLPETWIHRILTIKKDMFSTLFGYLRAALILMCITFTELFIGFSIINIKYALLLAFIIAVIDALPVLGAGGILIPWSLYSFVTNDIRMGVSILILYVVVLVVRQMVEPKVVGHQIGVYPLLTLMAMYTGLRLIGFAGLIIGPITFVLIRNILIAIYKNRTLKDILGFAPPPAKKSGAASPDYLPDTPEPQ